MATLSGTLAVSKAYDSAYYLQADPMDFSASAAGSGGLGQKFVSFTGRQLKSVTLLPAAAGTSNNTVQFQHITSLPVNFVGSGGSGTASFASGTSTVTLTNLGTFGSASAVPQYFPLAGGTYTITVVNGGSTQTATNCVLPQGPQGGLTVAALDQFYFKNGTDATATFTGEIESYFTPGTSFTA